MLIKDQLHWVGILNPGLRYFDFIPTASGTTCNSYLIPAQKPALVDADLEACREFGQESASRL
jgi:flavorubredoxin